MSPIRAVVVDPDASGRLGIREVAEPRPAPHEALVRVSAISLNPGETRRAMAADAGWRPGWDLAGVVLEPAVAGDGPPAGARVVGIKPSGAWAEVVAVPVGNLAVLPPEVSLAEAATLPVAGLTALRALERQNGLLTRRVLVTAASGAVGLFACRLARLAGAQVIGTVRRLERATAAEEAGAHYIVLDGDLATAGAVHGPYDLIVESVGAATLAAALRLLAPRGVCVSLGVTAGEEVTFNARDFLFRGGASVVGYHLILDILAGNAAGLDLTRLASLVADGRLVAPVELEAPWTEIGSAARSLLDRSLTGKAVLPVGG